MDHLYTPRDKIIRALSSIQTVRTTKVLTLGYLSYDFRDHPVADLGR